MKEIFKFQLFNKRTRAVIDHANVVLEEYTAQGFVLTLRQLYYQFVARGWLPNRQRSYKRLGDIVGKARLAGLIDWEHLEDRVRRLESLQHFAGAEDALRKLAGWYHVDMWAAQEWRPEVWIEKDALSGVISGVCQENDVPYFCCRGYTSLSEMWRASRRLARHAANGQRPFIIHLGDHDPSGIDMSRDILCRLQTTFLAACDFKRVALTMDQIEELRPPPNPAKISDSRYKAYVRDWGHQSWELDALNPPKFRELIELELAGIRDEDRWKKDLAAKKAVQARLKELSEDWEQVARNKRLVKDLAKQKAELEQTVEHLEAERDRLKASLSKRGRNRG